MESFVEEVDGTSRFRRVSSAVLLEEMRRIDQARLQQPIAQPRSYVDFIERTTGLRRVRDLSELDEILGIRQPNLQPAIVVQEGAQEENFEDSDVEDVPENPAENENVNPIPNPEENPEENPSANQVPLQEVQPDQEALESPSKKKRKRCSPDKLPKKDVEDDGDTCAICMDVFQAAGPHRIVALKCGHIFGESCIRRWLQGSTATKNCPHCKSKAAVRDIRFIYATKVKIIDNTREVELEMQLEQMQNEKQRLMNENSFSNMKYAMMKAEVQKLREEIEMLQNNAQVSNGRATAGIRSIKNGRIYIEKTLDFKENLDSRMLVFLSRNRKLIVTQKSAENSLFAGFGVKLIDFTTYRQEKFINTSNKVVNDFTVDSNESFVVTTSKESTCKMYHLSTAASIQSFAPASVPIWSCAFDKERTHNLLLGAQNGTTYIYDTRNTSSAVKELVPLETKAPVKFTIPIRSNETFPQGGFFVVHVRGLYFYEYLPSMEIASTKLKFQDSILVASYDNLTDMMLITKSPSGSGVDFKPSQHILMKLIREDGVPTLQEIFCFNGSNSPLPMMTRPTQVKVPDGFIVVNYLQDTKMIQARSPSVGLLHEISISDPIADFCPIYLDNSFFFGALSSSRCRLSKVNLGY